MDNLIKVSVTTTNTVLSVQLHLTYFNTFKSNLTDVSQKAVQKIENSIFHSSSNFVQVQVAPNLYELLCSVEHKRRYFEECW